MNATVYLDIFVNNVEKFCTLIETHFTTTCPYSRPIQQRDMDSERHTVFLHAYLLQSDVCMMLYRRSLTSLADGSGMWIETYGKRALCEV